MSSQKWQLWSSSQYTSLIGKTWHSKIMFCPFKTLSFLQTIVTYFQQTTFENIVSKLLIMGIFSLCNNVLNSLFNDYTLIYRDFSIFCYDWCFKNQLRRRFVVCGKWWLNLQQTAFNPFPHIDAFWRLCSRWLWKHSDKRKNCSWWAFSPFATMFSTFCHTQVIHSIMEIFYCLTKYVQSRLLQNCRTRKRVKQQL